MSRATQRDREIHRTKCPQRILYASAVLWLLLPACLWGQAQPLRQPVGSNLLQGGELIVESRNFAVTTPTGDWHWSVAENRGDAGQPATYFCTEAASGAELAVGIVAGRPSSDSKFKAGLKDGLERSLTAAGLTVASMDIAKSATPLPGSYRYQWHALRADGLSVYGYGYLTGEEPAFMLQHVTTEASEPPEFTQFARTFRLLHAPQPRSGSTFVAGAYILLLGSAWGVASLVNRAYGRVVLNGGTLGAILVLILLIVLIIVGNWAALVGGSWVDKGSQSPEYRVGQATIPLVIAALVARSFRKRKMREKEMLRGTRPPISR